MKPYSRSTEDKQVVVRRVKIVLEKPLTKAYLLFLCSALPIVNNFNRYMQQQSPILHVLYQELDGSVRKFLVIGLNKTKDTNRLGISTLNSLLTVQFNVRVVIALWCRLMYL